MALRVLLADESNTIKKVFQLALQDYAVEVRPVNIGLDVIPVAKKFNPDIIFADVLLQKRNGYDVSADVKAEDELSDTPVVLMWSGFMELDEDKYQACGANAHLEKPFDVNALRQIVQNLVPKTKTQKLSGYLSFPDMPEFEDSKPASPKSAEQNEAPPAQAKPSPEEQASASRWDMNSFDSIEETIPGAQNLGIPDNEDDFQQISLGRMKGSDSKGSEAKEEPPPLEEASLFLDDHEDDEEDNNWTRKDISRFKIDLDTDEEGDDVPVSFDLSGDEEPPARPSKNVVIDEDSPDDFNHFHFGQQPAAEKPKSPAAPSQEARKSEPLELPQLSPEKLEEIIRAQSKEVIESVVWKVVPELAKQVIERELQRLLEEKENQLF